MTTQETNTPPTRKGSPEGSRGRRGRDVPGFSLWDAVRAPSAPNLVLAVLLAAIAASAGAWWVRNQEAEYASATVLLIDQPGAIAAAGDDGAVQKLNQLRQKYVALIDTETIAAPAAAELGIPASQVQAGSSATAPPATLTLVVRALTDDRARAPQIASAVADTLIEYVAAEHEMNDIPAEQRYHFTVVNEPGNGRKVAPTTERAIAVAATFWLFGLGAGYVILQVATARRRWG